MRLGVDWDGLVEQLSLLHNYNYYDCIQDFDWLLPLAGPIFNLLHTTVSTLICRLHYLKEPCWQV